MKKKAPAAVTTIDFNSRKDLEWFRKAAKAYSAEARKDPAAARQLLIDEGIYTPSGRLSKNYR